MVLKIGAHVSIAGGFSLAIDRIQEIGGNCGQIFVHPPQRWDVPAVKEADAELFRKKYNDSVAPIVVHACYLCNMANITPKMFHASVNTLKKELDVMKALGLQYLVFHPGSAATSTEEQGIVSVAKGLTELAKNLDKGQELLVESMAGSGKIVCDTFDEISKVLEKAADERINVCIDTAHMFAAGYDIKTEAGLEKTLEEIENLVGMKRIKCIHLNDSKIPLGGKKDRHEDIGLGEIGNDAMQRFTTHKKLRSIPLVLETPSEKMSYAQQIERVKHWATKG